MRTSTKDPCTDCPALTERDEKPHCIFFEDEVDPSEDGCRHQFVNKNEVYAKLMVIKNAKVR